MAYFAYYAYFLGDDSFDLVSAIQNLFEASEWLSLRDYDAAAQLGVPPRSLFEAAAALLPHRPALAVKSFLERSPQDQSLDAMGYAIAADSDGFRYVRNW
jgi:hypothetical protein